MRTLVEQILDADPFQRDPRNDPAAIEERFKRAARERAATDPNLVTWVQQGNQLPACYR